MSVDSLKIFEQYRPILKGIAYRMCGMLADAEDLVQETYIRWSKADHAQIQHPRSWLVTVCSRLAIDHLESSRFQREQYIGTWLPEPLIDSTELTPDAQTQIDDSISMALMLALEYLSPAERAAFILHDVFGYDFNEIANIIGKEPAASRKLASRARTAVQNKRPRYQASPALHRQLLDAFFKAVRQGDSHELKTLLAESVSFYSDGGGKVRTASETLVGPEDVSEFFLEVWRHRISSPKQIQLVSCWFNGQPGVLIFQENQLQVAICADIEDQKIRSLYAIRNPEKLGAFQFP